MSSAPSGGVVLPFSRIVANEEDLVGLVAYSLYKQEKLAFVGECKQNGGVCDAQIQAFLIAAMLPSRLIAYREQANNILQDTTLKMFVSERAALASKMNEQITSEVKKLPAPEPLWRNWTRHFLQHILGSLMATFLAVMVLIAALGYKQGIGETLGRHP